MFRQIHSVELPKTGQNKKPGLVLFEDATISRAFHINGVLMNTRKCLAGLTTKEQFCLRKTEVEQGVCGAVS